jgi:hypothetical protein
VILPTEKKIVLPSHIIERRSTAKNSRPDDQMTR